MLRWFKAPEDAEISRGLNTLAARTPIYCEGFDSRSVPRPEFWIAASLVRQKSWLSTTTNLRLPTHNRMLRREYQHRRFVQNTK